MQLVVLNSSAYHATEAEVKHGRITQQTINLLKETLTSRTINILMCHHNPQKHSELLLGENDEIRGGTDTNTTLRSHTVPAAPDLLSFSQLEAPLPPCTPNFRPPPIISFTSLSLMIMLFVRMDSLVDLKAGIGIKDMVGR
jgi:hypothetical protein